MTDTSITLSAVGSFSGPVGAIYEQQHKAAMLTWRDEVNANGGINGRKVVINKVDDGNSAEGGVAACKAIESNGSFAAFTQSTGDGALACLEKAGIPAYQISVAAPNPNTAFKNVRALTSTEAEGAVMARWVAGPKGLNRAGHKIGLFYPTAESNAVVARQGEEFLRSAKALGLDVQGQKVSSNQPSFTGQLQQFKSNGVDTIVLNLVIESLGILRDAAAIGYKPLWTGSLFNADELAPAGAQAFTGIKSIRGWAAADSAAFQSFKGKVAKYGETTAPTTTNGLAYGALLVMQKALELAGRNLTRESFLAAFDQIKNFDVGLIPPVTYGPDRRIGMNATFPLECCNPDKTWKGLGPAQSNF